MRVDGAGSEVEAAEARDAKPTQDLARRRARAVQKCAPAAQILERAKLPPAPRRLNTTGTVLEKHGYTAGCLKCSR
eukprot:9347211-Alexandrium_andersonii.AAC.1